MQYSRGFEYGVIHLLADSTGPLTGIITKQTGLAPTEVDRLLAFGSIYHKNKRITHDQLINSGEHLRVHSRPRRFLRSVNWTEHLLWQDENFLLIDKPSGLPCHATVDNLYENVRSQLENTLERPLFPTHRLDLPTSGLLVFAKNQSSQSAFNRALNQSLVSKTYEALVEASNRPESIGLPLDLPLDLPLGLITHYMEVSPRAPKLVQKEPAPHLLRCDLEILAIKVVEDHRWVRIRLLTGRTHQIRAQLSNLGYPILGDCLYGSQQGMQSPLKEQLPWEAIALKSTEIRWGNYHWKLGHSFPDP